MAKIQLKQSNSLSLSLGKTLCHRASLELSDTHHICYRSRDLITWSWTLWPLSILIGQLSIGQFSCSVSEELHDHSGCHGSRAASRSAPGRAFVDPRYRLRHRLGRFFHLRKKNTSVATRRKIRKLEKPTTVEIRLTLHCLATVLHQRCRQVQASGMRFTLYHKRHKANRNTEKKTES